MGFMHSRASTSHKSDDAFILPDYSFWIEEFINFLTSFRPLGEVSTLGLQRCKLSTDIIGSSNDVNDIC